MDRFLPTPSPSLQSSHGSAWKSLMHTLRQTPGKNDKRNILASYAHIAAVPRLFECALNTFKTYYITAKGLQLVPGAKSANDDDFVALCDRLDELDRREKTGNDAKTYIASFISQFVTADQTEMLRFIDRNPNAGVSAKSINDVIPNTIPTFKVALANHYEKSGKYKKQQLPFAHTFMSRKLDGIRLIVSKRGDEIKAYSRTGNEFEKQIPEILETVKQLPIDDVVLDGEMVVIDRAGRENFSLAQGLMNSSKDASIRDKRQEIARINAQPKYLIFDMLSPHEFASGEGNVPYIKKYAQLRDATPMLTTKYTEVVENKPIASFKEMMDYFDASVDKGWEGIMLRNGDKPYRATGEHISDLLKLKLFQDAEFPVIGCNPGEPRSQYENTLGTIIIQMPDGNTVNVPGFKDRERDEIWAQCPDIVKRAQKGTPRIATVTFREYTTNKDTGLQSLHHPNFKGWRDVMM